MCLYMQPYSKVILVLDLFSESSFTPSKLRLLELHPPKNLSCYTTALSSNPDKWGGFVGIIGGYNQPYSYKYHHGKRRRIPMQSVEAHRH